jgi:hypothetical protein
LHITDKYKVRFNALYTQFLTVRVLTINTIKMNKDEIEELVKSDNNGKDWFDSYQEVDNFLFNELEKLNIDFPLLEYNMKPELNTIEAIKLLTEALVDKQKDSIV